MSAEAEPQPVRTWAEVGPKSPEHCPNGPNDLAAADPLEFASKPASAIEPGLCCMRVDITEPACSLEKQPHTVVAKTNKKTWCIPAS